MSFLKEAWSKAVDVIAFVPRMAVKATEFIVGNGAYYGSRLIGADTETAQARYDKVKDVGSTIKGAINSAAEFAKHPIQSVKNAFNANADLNPMNWLRRTLERVSDWLLDKAQGATISIAGEGAVSNWLGEMRDKEIFYHEAHDGTAENTAGEDASTAPEAEDTAPEEGLGPEETVPAEDPVETQPQTTTPQGYVPQAPVGGRPVMQPGF